MQSSHLDKNKSIGVKVIHFILFLLPLGKIQNHILYGITAPKILIPICFVLQLYLLGKNYIINPVLPLLLIFILITTPSFLVGSEEYYGVFISFIGYAIFFQVYLNANFTVDDFLNSIKWYVVGVLFISCCTILEFLGLNFSEIFGRHLLQWWYGSPVFLGGEDNPNAFAAFFVPGLTGISILIAYSKSYLHKVAYLCLYVSAFIVLLLTYSRSAILGSIIGTFVVYASLKQHSSSSGYSFVKLAGTIFLCIYGFYLLFNSIVGIFINENSGVNVFSNKETSIEYRLLMGHAAIDALVNAGIFGIGYGNYSKLVETIIGEAINSHNIFLGIGIEFGLLSLSVFILLLGITFFIYTNCFKCANTQKLRLISTFFIGSLLGLTIHGLFHETIVNFLFWYMIAAAFPLYYLVINQKS